MPSLTRVIVTLLAAVVVLSAVAPVASAAEMPNSLGLSATYDVTATLTWSQSRLTVNSTALVTNDTDNPVDAITFNIAPAKIGQMAVTSVTVGDVPATYLRSGQTMTVTLPAPLAPSEHVAVTIAYDSIFGTVGTDKQWLFVKKHGIATAYRWIPWLSRKVKFNRPNIGDPFVTAVSSDVRVKFTSDRTLVYATSGVHTAVKGLTQTFEAHNVRDFNFTASPYYLKRVGTWGGIEITVYYRELPPGKMLNWSIAAIQRFSQKVGPYPYATYSVAEVPYGQGMESPALVWIAQTTPISVRQYTTTHETAHQWFYGVVGNDQTTEPFTDEAMTDFMTRDFFGHRASRCTEATLDSTIYEYSNRCYYEVVYVQGDNYLEAFRLCVGDEPFWTAVRTYYQTYANQIVGIRELLDTLETATTPELPCGHPERFPRTYVPV